MEVLIIIVTYNGMQWIKKCLDSVKESSVRAKMFVIDNGSTDGTQTFIRNNYPEVIFIQSQQNLGFGKANNLGLRYALEHNYKYVYLLNQDAWLFPETLSIMIELSKKHLDYAILSPMQLQGNLQHLDSNFVEYTCRFDSNRELISDLYFNSLNDIYEVDFVMAAHWLIPTDVLRKIGIFSPSFPHYGEDNNLIHRAQYHGYKVGIVLTAKAVHDREDRKETKQKKIYLIYINILSLLSNPNEKHFLLLNLLTFIKLVVKYKSILPLKYMFDLCTHYSFIKKNKKISMLKDGAFI